MGACPRHDRLSGPRLNAGHASNEDRQRWLASRADDPATAIINREGLMSKRSRIIYELANHISQKYFHCYMHELPDYDRCMVIAAAKVCL